MEKDREIEGWWLPIDVEAEGACAMEPLALSCVEILAAQKAATLKSLAWGASCVM
jgi:hypothetical protein